MAIITISREVGSLGDEIAETVTEKLGYEIIEKSQISEALSEHGFMASDVDKLDEKKPSILQILSKQKNIFDHLIRSTVYDFAARDNVVIVGRGAQIILKGIPGTLHVRITAPYDARVHRIMEQLECEYLHAEQHIRLSDRESSGYISTYFHADWDDGTLYDLVINTRSLTLNTAVDLITEAAKSIEIKEIHQTSERLKDFALSQKGKAVLLEVEGIEVADLDVARGVATLSGMARSLEAKEECKHAILTIKGIAEVNNQINVPPEDSFVD